MKLINKFLTALAPVVMVGVITPTLVACNKGSSYTFEYGDPVNCLKRELGHYHSRSQVKNAVKSKISLEPRGEVKLTDINKDLIEKGHDFQIRYLYYELIASKVWCANENVSVIGWDDTTAGKITLSYCDDPKTLTLGETWFTYVQGTGEHTKEVYIQVEGLTNPFKSYAYSYCTIEQN